MARGDSSPTRVQRWRAVIEGLLSGDITPGSRKPVSRYPAWVTLDVATGGFATGASLAAGPLLPHENVLLEELGLSGSPTPRLALNRYFLSDTGLARLQAAITGNRYVIDVAEEAALPAIAWLMAHGHADEAGRLAITLAPYAHELRFYPRLDVAGPTSQDRVHLESAGKVVQRLRTIPENPRIMAQRNAVGTWTPLYDEAIGLALETVDGELPVAAKGDQGDWIKTERGQFSIQGGWPFKIQPPGWPDRVRALLEKIAAARVRFPAGKRYTGSDEPFVILTTALDRAVRTPEELSARDVGRVRLILARYVAKRGLPDSDAARLDRARQLGHATTTSHKEIAVAVADELAGYPSANGLDDLAALSTPGSYPSLPPGILRRLQRCLNDTPTGLIERGVIKSSEVLATLLPQRSSQLCAAGFPDLPLRLLYAATYRAFRRRRSLLLLDLQKQVQLGELPWVAALETLREDTDVEKRAAGRALEEFASLTIAQFPQTIIPNKLLQEFNALARQAGLSLPLTEELAADIFMGRFAPKFIDAAKVAAAHLRDTLYATYFRLDYGEIVRGLSKSTPSRATADALATICAQRAGEPLGAWKPAGNGRILEQQLIITSHNLAALLELPEVKETLTRDAIDLARRCYAWILRCLGRPCGEGDWRVELRRIKNSAYAWRQMVFLLSLREPEAASFVAEAQALLAQEPEPLARRFRPALNGLRTAILTPDAWRAAQEPAPFLGWSDTQRWRARPAAAHKE
ncbi:hypothetical protein ASB57_06255 [Bordetella sp. N]|nr:hypothetical protein ASB57_06255 [Bordetella sp. N]